MKLIQRFFVLFVFSLLASCASIDDGKRTYIAFPINVLTGDMPAVFENRADIVNYRVNQNIMIIDKLIEKVTIKLGDRIATVEKKKGK